MQEHALAHAEVSKEPKVLRGAVLDWPAIRRWQGRSGLERLKELAGSAQVQAMLNHKQDSLFFGDMRQFSPSTCSFTAFLTTCQQSSDNAVTSDLSQRDDGTHQQIHAYLAQASLLPGQPLHALQQDFSVPEPVRHAKVSHTNLWMNFRPSRCSLHYDPYHNLLCMVQGQKTVKLMSPEATAFLYPHSVLGESPNHSQVNFADPDLHQHPLYPQALQLQQEYVLEAGDALFIPEGWWHQVDSLDSTIAINFWWPSAFSRCLQPHMNAYYLRRVLDSLLDTERQKALQCVKAHPQLQQCYNSCRQKGRALDLQDMSVVREAQHSAAPMSDTCEERQCSHQHQQRASLFNAIDAVRSSHHPQQQQQQDQQQHQQQQQQDRQQRQQVSVSSEDGAFAVAGTAATTLACSRRSDVTSPQHVSSTSCARKRKAGGRDLSSARGDEAHSGCGAASAESSLGSSAPDSDDDSDDNNHGAERRVIVDSGDAGEQQQPTKRPRPSEASDPNGAGLSELHVLGMSRLADAVAIALSQGSNDDDANVGLNEAVTQIMHALQPRDLQQVLLLMAHRVPRTLQGLLLHALSPAAAEVLTCKLELASAEAGDQGQKEFYEALYSVADDPQQVLHHLLDLKEAFSQHVCHCTLSRVLGVDCSHEFNVKC